ncbi:uncharacterized protein LOC121244660 [Juglans microcarpa x Juglans regia]|uniref:uncharacterized protein LOC121244660 n=1 Tax=Juglans microcarpa x Juglans regia TaxID=2249226 RepID=UPI001B7ED3CD|nr:uncharacterized protein LOC121244660 [Juglans microcarpa x Juglans regia]
MSFTRNLRRDLRFYLKQISSKIAIIRHSMSVQVLRPHTRDPHDIEHILFYSVSKPVLISNDHDSEDMESVISYRSFPSSNGSSENSIMRNMTMLSSFAYRSNEDETSMDIGASYELQESDDSIDSVQLKAILQAVSVSETGKKTSF